MNTLPKYTSVVIVGAGPSGLMMAAQLLRFGIQPLIIDSKTELNHESRALAVQARSLEIFRQMDLDGAALKAGNIARGIVLHQGLDEIASFDLSNAGEGKSKFPFVLILEQSKTERILLDHLTSNTCPIYWNTKLVDLHQTDGEVTLNLLRDNIDEVITCDWLIAADGASSTVRKALKIPFSGGTYEQKFFLADVKINGGISQNAVRAFFTENGFTAIFPMEDANYRFIGVLPKVLEDKVDLTFEHLRPFLTFNLGFPMSEECCNWFSVYQLHNRMADRFRVQRCFLIGDAAHVHSPAGGQGMNTGLQDAHNLAWKLAGVISGKYSGSVLDSYSKERMPVAKALLQSTDKMFSIIVGQSWIVSQIRRWLLPFMLNKVWKASVITKKMFGLISQTGISYQSSSLSVHHSLAKQVRAGDRLPFVKIFDEKLKEETDLHAWCNHNGFTLIIIGFLSQRDLLVMVKWIKLNFPFGLQFFYLPYSEKNQNIFDIFEMKENHRKILVVRPDMHIGYMNDVIDVELIGGYLGETIGWQST